MSPSFRKVCRQRRAGRVWAGWCRVDGVRAEVTVVDLGRVTPGHGRAVGRPTWPVHGGGGCLDRRWLGPCGMTAPGPGQRLPGRYLGVWR
jgi:hypothetical protein